LEADEHDEVVIDPSAVSAALQKLNSDPEPEARFMRMANGYAPVYNVQTGVDAEHAIVVAQQFTTEARIIGVCCRWPQPRNRLSEGRNVERHRRCRVLEWRAGDTMRSAGQGASTCQPIRAINNKGNGKLFDRTLFAYDERWIRSAVRRSRRWLADNSRWVM